MAAKRKTTRKKSTRKATRRTVEQKPKPQPLMTERQALQTIAVELHRHNQLATAQIDVFGGILVQLKELASALGKVQSASAQLPDQSQMISQVMELIRVPLELAVQKSERQPPVYTDPRPQPEHVAIHESRGMRLTQRAPDTQEASE